MSETPVEHHEDEIHMPPNSIWPLVVSIGITISMVGLVTLEKVPFLFPLGIIVLLGSLAGWVRDARREHQELH